MNTVKILSHFSKPSWPLVNKLVAVTRCLGVDYTHCSQLNTLTQALSEADPDQRLLFFTDEKMIEVVREIHREFPKLNLEVGMFIISRIERVAKEAGELPAIRYLIGNWGWNLIGQDLSVLIKKFLDRENIELDKYLAFGAGINRREITSKKTRQNAVNDVYNFIVNLGSKGYSHPFEEYGRRLAEVVDELLLNAVFHANPRLRGRPYNEDFQLENHEKILLTFGFDGEYFGVSVRDPFGSFARETIMQYLSSQKTLEQVVSGKSGGLGLKFIFERTHKFIANIQKEQMTDILCLVHLEGRMIDFEKQTRSLYYFAEEKKVN